MLESNASSASVEACPVCGAHRLALLEFPHVSGAVHLIDSEMFAVRMMPDQTPPGIGCLACGSEWEDVTSFRTALDEATERDV